MPSSTAHEHGPPGGTPGEGREDTVTLFIGRPGYEREALAADPLAEIVRPPDAGDGEVPAATGAAGAGTASAEGAGEADRERPLRIGLWLVLGLASAACWTASRGLPWLDGASRAAPTGRELLARLPLTALVAGGVLLVVFAASVTLCARPGRLLPGAALGAALTALHAAPVALGREPEPVAGTFYRGTAGFLAEAVGLGGPEPLLRWAPPVLLLLCLVPLERLLAYAGGRLPRPGRWGALYLAAVAGWVWGQALAPVAPPLLLLLTLLALVLSTLRRPPASAPAPTPAPASGQRPDPTPGPEPTPGPVPASTPEPPHCSRPNDRSRD
jgi:hypothetical protein